MKWFVIIIILIIVIGFYLMIKRQKEYNEEELRRSQLLKTVSNFGTTNIQKIEDKNKGVVNDFINSKFVTTTSGIFGKVLGIIY